MKRTGSVIVAATALAMILLAGTAVAGGSDLRFSRDGNIVTITGSTNLAAGDRLIVDVVSAEFTPTEKENGTVFSGAQGTVVVGPGSPMNTYHFDVNVSAFSPGLYLVTVTSLETSFQDSGRFVLPWTPVPAEIPSLPAPGFPPATTPSPALTSMPAPHAS
ncbi:MAG TPA: hypothetical protein VK450_01830, partial [Methanomicrobiales archaeon]|nr:hypothetical protein [Methanomicrobiales archaeon]